MKRIRLYLIDRDDIILNSLLEYDWKEMNSLCLLSIELIGKKEYEGLV